MSKAGLGTAMLLLIGVSGGPQWAAFALDVRLLSAAKQSDIKTVRILLQEHAEVNSAEPDGSTALHWAVQQDNPALVDLLIASGANVKAVTR